MVIENAINLELALAWLKNIVTSCLKIHFGQAEDFEIRPLNLHKDNSWLAQFIAGREPGFEEFAILMLAITPHLHPQFFNNLISEYLSEGGDFPEFGGVKGSNHRGCCPPAKLHNLSSQGTILKNVSMCSVFWAASIGLHKSVSSGWNRCVKENL